MRATSTGNIPDKNANGQTSTSAAGNPMQLLIQKQHAGNPFAPSPQKPAFNPLQRQFVVQRKVTANNFKQFLDDQEKLTEDMQHPEQLQQKYTTAGFECEFISMLDGQLQNFTHHEVAKTEGRFIKQLPFVLETDAMAALEFITPPFLVETVGNRPIPLASDLKKIDSLMKAQLATFTTAETTVGKLVEDFKGIGINFHLEDATVNVNSFADIARESNLTQDTPEVKKEDVENIKLGTGKKHNGGMSSQVNFATDAATYQELLEPAQASRRHASFFKELEDKLTNLVIIHSKYKSPGFAFFCSEFARSMSGLLSTPYAQASVEHKKAGFERREADNDATMNIQFNNARAMASLVKDVKNVWIKDTLMNIVASSMTGEDLTNALALLTNQAFNAAIDNLSIHALGASSDSGPVQAHTRKNIRIAIQELTAQVDLQQKNMNNTIDFTNGKKVGFMGHDSGLIGARQDTYISPSNTSLPQWNDRRLHVVESRNDIEEVIDKLGDYEPGYMGTTDQLWHSKLDSIPEQELVFIMKTQLFKDLDKDKANAHNNLKETERIISRFESNKAFMLSTGKIVHITKSLEKVKTTNNDSGIATIEAALERANRANNNTINNVSINQIQQAATERLGIKLAKWRLSDAEYGFYQAMEKL